VGFRAKLKATCACRIDSDLFRLQDFFCAFDGQPASSNESTTLSDGSMHNTSYLNAVQMSLLRRRERARAGAKRW